MLFGDLMWIAIAVIYLFILLIVNLAKGPRPGSQLYNEIHDYDDKKQFIVVHYLSVLFNEEGCLDYRGDRKVYPKLLAEYIESGFEPISITDEEKEAVRKYRQLKSQSSRSHIENSVEAYEEMKQAETGYMEAFETVKELAIKRASEILATQGLKYDRSDPALEIWFLRP